jgi:hypothetical protein
VAYSASIGHQIDVGGGAAGPNAQATEIYQEGLRIPPVKFELERDLGRGILEQFIRFNVRQSDQVMGDVYAQVAANKTGEHRFVELSERFGIDVVLEAGAEVQDYTERLTRDAIRSIPDGVYGRGFVDDNGFTDEPAREGETHDQGQHARGLHRKLPQTKESSTHPCLHLLGLQIDWFLHGAVPVKQDLPAHHHPVPCGSFRPIVPSPCAGASSGDERYRKCARGGSDRVLTSGHIRRMHRHGLREGLPPGIHKSWAEAGRILRGRWGRRRR